MARELLTGCLYG